jgi:glutamate-1-semialdehyde 2,1-aminomutase
MSFSERLHKAIPGGAHTYSRGDDQFPSNAPQILERGKGAHVWDAQGRRYVDWGMGLRSVGVGYDFDRISEAAIRQIRNGNNLTRPSRVELEAAERLIELIPWVDMVKFAKNGSTVTTAAVKLARAATGRDIVARCQDHPFFSFDDWFIGDTLMDRGIPDASRHLTLDFRFNDIASLEKLFAANPGRIAAVILEPATSEEPAEGFLAAVRTLCTREGALLVLDEMITGFRWDLRGACSRYQVEPDLVTYGKAMANGFSVAALGGKREYMELGGIRHGTDRIFLISTTHGAEMCGLGAFLETVSVYRELGVVEAIWKSGSDLVSGLRDVASKAGVADNFRISGLPCSPAYAVLGTDGKPSMELRTLFQQEMVRAGVLMPWIAPSYSHGPDVVAQTLEAAVGALGILRKALDSGTAGLLEGPAIKPVFRKRN